MSSYRKAQGANLLQAAIARHVDPQMGAMMALESRLINCQSTWEFHNPARPLIEDKNASAARAVGNGVCYVSTHKIGYSEVSIATMVRKMLTRHNAPITAYGKGLSDSQIHAAGIALSSDISILTGGPGTGKTYTLCAIVDSLEAAGLAVLLAAPTGTAAKRVAQSTGRPASTLHRMLRYRSVRKSYGYEWEFGHNEHNPLRCDCLIVDEATMIDNPLMVATLRALGDARLILVGDADQIPPVGIGAPFHALLDVVPTARLTEVRRTDPDGPIGMACVDILSGRMPRIAQKGETGFFMIPRAARDVVDYILHCALRMNGQSVCQVGILTPYNKYCDIINKHILEHSSLDYVGNYPIMCTKNDYEAACIEGDGEGVQIFNGDVGYSATFPCDWFDFEGSKLVFQKWRDRLSFARTVHKSQGSEWGDVILHFPKNRFMSRNLSYVAVSRGKGRVAVLGDIGSFEESLSDERRDYRLTLLRDLVTGKASVINGG